MYYYIAEPTTTNIERKKIEEIQSILSQLGIAGEFAVASPARSVEEHLELAFRKGFTTIVGIGSDALANQVASSIFREGYDTAVLGFIPLRPRQALWNMIGTTTIREACQQLRTRFVVSIDALQIDATHTLITDAVIQLPAPVRFLLHYRGSTIQGQLTDATISHNGTITLTDTTYRPKPQGRSLLERIFGGRKQAIELASTSVQASRWQLETETPCSITVDGSVVATTPLDATTRPKALKLITVRDKVAKEKE